MQLLTWQIDVSLIQEKLGIWIDKFASFLSGTGVEAVTSFITYKITANVMWAVVLFLCTFVMILYTKKLVLFCKRNAKESDWIVWCLFAAYILLLFILFIQLFSYMQTVLLRSISPEFAIINYFTK